MTRRRALITGVTGQDGSYLAEFLASKDYEIHVVMRRTSAGIAESLARTGMAPHVYEELVVHRADLTESGRLHTVIDRAAPHEIYHLAAQSHVHASFDQAEYTGDVTALGATRLLDAAHDVGLDARFFQASSSEMYGSTPAPQSEASAFAPRSPYAIAKLHAYWTARLYREAYGMFVTNGILFNHESPRRGVEFVTRKIAVAAARISRGLDFKLELGNLDARRDWGFAPEYVEAMWLALQHDRPDDFVFATGHTMSVGDFAHHAFAAVGIDSLDVIVENPCLRRPAEVDDLRGDATHTRETLGWRASTLGPELARLMVDAEVDRLGLSGSHL
ncbi:MAG: GDP-mannose 4,6-dehydratase [Demequinaceae bacterium]|nr:GDP-mannose 4,6-dehydratase [Demequinaceae bacterium]